MPTISVILPVYNAAEFILPTLQSVLSQTFQDFELIVVDDGSTDSTRQVLDPYADRMRYIYKSNGGQSSSRNAGIRAACGEYIALLDHDDLWFDNKLELQLNTIRESAAIGMVTCGSTLFSGDKDLFTEIPRPNTMSRHQLQRQLALGNLLGSCSKALVRSECFRNVGLFDESLRMAEDWDMWFRISQCYDIRSIERPLVRYRVHEMNFSARSGELNLKNELAFLSSLFRREEFRTRRLLRRHAFAMRYMAAAIAFRPEHDRRGVRRSLLRGLSQYPPIAFSKTFWALALFSLRPGRNLEKSADV